eukprot:2556367-Ditylum_brightwellii.AAC.1
MEDHFTETITKGIYCDDGLVVFSGFRSKRGLRRWQKCFQQQINDILGGNFLQFKVEIWYDNRTLYFVLSHSKIWGNTTVPKTIKRLKKCYKLNWLRVQMAYSCFLNICEKFNSNLVTKGNEGIECRDFGSWDCNYTHAVKVN